MPSLLSLPRELRDMIYREVLDGNTSLKPSQRPRRSHDPLTADTRRDRLEARLAALTRRQNEADAQVDAPARPAEPDYRAGEAAVRYSLAEPIPPTHSVLQACRQLRTEMLDTIRRNKVRYRIRLSFRNDAGTIYPTWISLPAFSTHIDVLEVEIRFREKKTPSLFSVATSDTDAAEADVGAGWYNRDPLLGGMVLLRRFLERGPFLIAKKKAKKTTIETLVLRVEPKDYPDANPRRDLFEDLVESLDEEFLSDRGVTSEYRDEFFRFFAERITRVQLRVGEQCKEWLFADILAQVDRRQELERLGPLGPLGNEE